MLPTEQQIKDAAPIIAKNLHRIFENTTLFTTHTLLVDDVHGIYCAQRFTQLYATHETFISIDEEYFHEAFEELLTAINEHTPEPYTVFWHEGGLWYGDESAFFED